MLSKILSKKSVASAAKVHSQARGFSAGETVRITKLHKYHQERLGGKMVPFAGYEMPV